MYLRIAGRMVDLWRAVDAEGEVLDVLVRPKRNKPAALKLMRRLLKKYGFVPNRLITDKLPSYAGALRQLGIESGIGSKISLNPRRGAEASRERRLFRRPAAIRSSRKRPRRSPIVPVAPAATR